MQIGISLGLGAGSGAAGSPAVVDTFTRADNASSLGSAETGQAWTAQALTWGISEGRAYIAAGGAGTGVATVDAGAADGVVEADVVWTTGTVAILVFRSDGTLANRWTLEINSTGSALNLQKRVASSNTAKGSAVMTFDSGQAYRLRVEIRGSAITAFLDGVEKIATTDADLQTATHHGIGAFHGSVTPTVQHDNFRLTR